LEPAKIATIQMQKNDLNPGDCFGIWLNTQMKLKKLNIPLSKKLLTKINNCEDSIFHNPVFESGIVIFNLIYSLYFYFYIV